MPVKKINFHKRELGYGAYTVSDVSRILGKSPQKVFRYIKEYGDAKFGKKLFNETYSWFIDDVRVINFHALVELYIFFLLREKYGLKISEINGARESLATKFNTPYPFATTRKLLTDRKSIFYEYLDEIIHARTHGYIFKEIFEPFLEKVEWSNEEVVRFFPLGKDRTIVVDPLHQFGQPTINRTNLRVQTIWRMYDSKESKESIKILFNLTEKEFNDALDYYNPIKRAA